jgi:Abnormal spindle-like microcephaly-assoc'd, ASPM-SPD-2-Hydin
MNRGSFLFRTMCLNLRALWIFVLPLLVVFVTPSAFAQSWVSSVAVTTTNITATINWTTAVPATSRIKYGLTTSYGTLTALNSNFTTAHSVSLTALTAGTIYHYRVLSADATGVRVTGLDYTFTTLTASVNVSVSPTTATVVSGGSQQFSAQVTNTSNTAVTWSATAGTVSSTGLFSAPTVTANTTVTVTATSVADPTKHASATVTVNAPGTLSIVPSTLGLGSVVVGQSGTASGTIAASGTSVTVTAASSSNSVFSVGGLSLPVTIPAGQSVPFTITFSPMVSGAVNATLTLTSNANPATTTEGLTGSGTSAGTHSVALSWNASTSSGILGYNVYRAPYTTSCGAYAKLNPALNTGTLYTDTTVANGNNYCYATTAVDSSSQESTYSNIVSNVQVPTN